MHTVHSGFSVLSLNLRFGLSDDGPNSWKHRKKALPALFKSYRDDFIGFQEANDFQIDYLKTILTEYKVIGKRDPAASFWQSNVIFFRNGWELTFFSHFFLSPTPSIPSRFRESRWPRQCTLGMFENNNKRLICMNTHFDFAEAVQTQSAGIILEHLSYLPADVPAILMGDFNATPKNDCYRVFTVPAHLPTYKGPWFKNTAAEPFPGTYHGFKGKPNDRHIDWILYRGRLNPLNHTVIEKTFQSMYPSDHFPVHAKFNWIDEV